MCVCFVVSGAYVGHILMRGEGCLCCPRPSSKGNAYLDAEFPKLTRLITARVVPAPAATAHEL